MVRHTLKILQFYYKTFKVCLTLLERYALKRQDLKTRGLLGKRPCKNNS